MRGQILIIDDNPMDIKVISAALNASGWACFGFTNHVDATIWLTENSPQMIFLDLQMPTVTGYQLIPILRKISNAAKAPIIIVSGKNESEDILKAIKLGAVDYIVKPLDPLVLQEKVERTGSKQDSDFHAFDLATEDQVTVFVAKPVKVVAISEFGTKLISETPITPGENAEINGLPIDLFGKEKLLMRCLTCEPTPSKKEFIMQMTFVGMTEPQRKHIRKACRQKWLESKNESEAKQSGL